MCWVGVTVAIFSNSCMGMAGRVQHSAYGSGGARGGELLANTPTQIDFVGVHIVVARAH